ncbi:hypothetical protein COV15_00740 [Candidatus Woesearchaeota archaeon CG10_big_fil_rev_8_21_14_0_10_34_12]|nr:MAG: hypothetical protein COV15_00740 [Candidatus Woesearchaeota archaeon CG10_big_fil_rev_8_21_14_0_10_34_12]
MAREHSLGIHRRDLARFDIGDDLEYGLLEGADLDLAKIDPENVSVSLEHVCRAVKRIGEPQQVVLDEPEVPGVESDVNDSYIDALVCAKKKLSSAKVKKLEKELEKAKTERLERLRRVVEECREMRGNYTPLPIPVTIKQISGVTTHYLRTGSITDIPRGHSISRKPDKY